MKQIEMNYWWQTTSQVVIGNAQQSLTSSFHTVYMKKYIDQHHENEAGYTNTHLLSFDP